MNTDYRELNFDNIPEEEMKLFCDAVDEQADFVAHFVQNTGWTPDEQKK